MYCPKCGNQLEEGSNFCKSCGNNVTGVEPKRPASAGKRLANLFVDSIGHFIFGLILIFIISVPAESIMRSVINIFVFLTYSIFFEALWQKTPGKWITGTKVVNRDGTKPSFWRIVGRSFARFIPFEALSFLVNAHPQGWHDRFSRTLVVPAHYTEEDVKSIDLSALKKNNSVVILIIVIFGGIMVVGIIASVVLASLGSARSKGNDAMIKSSIVNARAEIELSRTEDGYPDFCKNNKFLAALADKNHTHVVCHNNTEEYAISAKLSSEKYFCVDSTSFVASESDIKLPDGEFQCPTQSD